MHDARLGRFLSIDPLAPKYPHNSPYAFSENRVINSVELEGLEAYDVVSEQSGPWSEVYLDEGLGTEPTLTGPKDKLGFDNGLGGSGNPIDLPTLNVSP
jgi:hypothetical protein